jgi:hypothetical protein
LGLLLVLCSERESRSSFFNRAAGVKKVVHSGLRSSVNTLVARDWRNAVSLFGWRPFLRSGLSIDLQKGHLCGIGSGLSR